MDTKQLSTIRYIDLFAGIGGFHFGLESASNRFQCVYSNEWDKYANSVYKKHFGECDNRDIRTVAADEIPDFDLLCGGFPCQSFSIAGKRGGFDDTRGTLFFEIARIIKQKQPRLLLLENVKGLLSHDQGNTFRTILSTLDELGYDAEWQVLNSKNFGVPQNRERVLIVGHLRGTPRPQVFPIRGANPKALNYVGGILSAKAKMWLDNGKKLSRNFPQGSRVYSDDGVSATLASQAGGLGAKTGLYLAKNLRMPDQNARTLTATAYKGSSSNGMTIIPVLTPEQVNKRQNGRRFKENGEPSFTITTQDRHGVLLNKGELKIKDDEANCIDSNYHKGLDNHGQRTAVLDNFVIRKLTPVECERLQGFPDNWTAEGQCQHCNGWGFLKYKRDDGVFIDVNCEKCSSTGMIKMSDTQRYKMCGNAVTTSVISAIASKLACTRLY